MAHPREQIAEVVVALLVAAGTAAGTRVVSGRVDPHKKTGLPALSVYARKDPTSDAGSSEMEDGHELELVITGWAVPDEIDDLADDVEAVMRDDPYLGGLASDSTLRGTVIEGKEDDGRSDPIVAIAALTYAVTYHIALEPT